MTLRSAVARQMVRFHEIPLELAEYHVGMMDPGEVKETFLSYWRRGMELSAVSPTKKSCPDFYQVFGSATTTAGLRPSTAFLEQDTQREGLY